MKNSYKFFSSLIILFIVALPICSQSSVTVYGNPQIKEKIKMRISS